ncbi:MAG: exodeoxyribonuclease III [Armatimonadetes bacterium]|nr:exodeoxyribonuclease III [Armatimonadota bacterium]
MRIATFNVNGIRARVPVVTAFLQAQQPDVLCMQETKVVDEDFPREAFEALGYQVAFRGEKSYNGVAIAGRLPMKRIEAGFTDGGPPDETRLLKCEVEGVVIINTYVPQGRDVESEHFRYKLQWLARLRAYVEERWTPRKRILWLGDINVAPEPRDVYAPDRLLNHPDFHPEARAALASAMEFGFVDLLRLHNDEDGQYSYFDYRNPRAIEHNSGWRVDLILATKALAKRSTACWIDMQPRLMDRPSDHTPVIAEFEL